MAPEPLVLINSCVMIVANLAVCATISIYRFSSQAFCHSYPGTTGGESPRLPDLRFHLKLTKRMSSAFSLVVTLFLPTVLVMNIAVTTSVPQTVILKTASLARVQIAKTMILKQIRVKLT